MKESKTDKEHEESGNAKTFFPESVEWNETRNIAISSKELRNMIIVKPIPHANRYLLMEDFTYDGITVPAGFHWDGASIPSSFWHFLNLTPFSPSVLRASLMHDYLAETKLRTKEENDLLFKNMLLEDGVNEEAVKWMYIALVFLGELEGSAMDFYLKDEGTSP